MRMKISIASSRLAALLGSFLLTGIGCYQTAPQEVDLTALRQALSRLNAQPAILDALPDTWLDESGVHNRGCRGDRADISKVYRTTYSHETRGTSGWYVNVGALVFCFRENAARYASRSCNRWSQPVTETVKITVDELGTACASAVVQQRSHGLIPADTYLSFVTLQSGVLVVEFWEVYRGKLAAAKQVAINDVTSRLVKFLDQYSQPLSSLAQ